MSSPEDATIEAVLDEVRAIAHGLNKIGDDTRMIRAHLAEIDAQLEAMPQRDEIDALRAIVGELQTAVSELQAFVNSDPPLQDRLVALEENVAQYKVDTKARENVIADDAGTATDPAHREMAQEEAGVLVDASEGRTEVKLVRIRDRAETIAAYAKENQSTLLVLLAIAALAGMVAMVIVVRAWP